METDDAGPLVWLMAGEPSGDLLGAGLMTALRQRTDGRIRFAGIGGAEMEARGLASRFPISEIAVMGLVEVVPRLLPILRRVRETAAQILAEKPDVVVSIDSPGFARQVWKRLAGAGIPLVHYVAPTVWAWKPGRARELAARLDHLMALLPFEPPYFEKEGLSCSFVGHPVAEPPGEPANGAGFRAAHGVAPDATVISVLPGSRRGEIARLLPPFREAARTLARRGTVFCFPTLPHLAGDLAGALAGWPGRALIADSPAARRDAIAASDAALAASGTVTLELAAAGVPHVVAYRMNGLTVGLFRLMGGARLRHVNLVNILLDRTAIPEFLQADCRGDRLAEAVAELLDDEAARSGQLAEAARALAMLRPDGGSPSSVAAAAVMAHVRCRTAAAGGRGPTDGGEE